ncbi:MAG TPA: glutathione S-transferase family protein [Rhizomicrobium sp.]|jgi:glutathione S-transferase
MLILYHCFSARSFRPLWALEEMRLDYELRMLPFPPRVLQKEYLAINPLGTIPALLDGDTLMTESAAICEYLATSYGPTDLAVKPEEPGYGAYLNALHFGEATLTFPQTLVLRYTRLEPKERRVPQVAQDYAKWFLGRLRAVEARIGSHEYMAADRFTMADISVAYALMLAKDLGLDAQFTPGVAAYWTRVSARDGYRRAFERQTEAARAAGLRAAI